MFRLFSILSFFFCFSSISAQIDLPVPPPQEVHEDAEKVVFDIVEQMPEYKDGGSKGFIDFVSKNIHYPDYAIDNSLEGTVYIRMIITEAGKLENIHAIREIKGAEILTKEAIRVVKLSDGNWIPGMQRGKAVDVFYNLPIRFKLK
jgi:periplasmic protein TonB